MAIYSRLEQLEVDVERMRALISLRKLARRHPGKVARAHHLRFPEPRVTLIMREDGAAPPNRDRRPWETGLELDVDLVRGLPIRAIRALHNSKEAMAILRQVRR